MYAIVEMAGQQFKVAKDQKVYVHRLKEEEGDKVVFDNVLLLDDGKNVTIGAPAIDGATVKAQVVKHLKGDKVIVFKKKRRKGYRKKNGHRQYLTEIRVEGIVIGGARKDVSKASEHKVAAPKEGAAKPEAKTQETPKTSAPKKAAVKELDDLKKIEGIGPKAAEALKNAGIGTFAALAKSNPDKIKELLTEASSRLAHLDPGTWPEQAQLAADGQWDELKELQDKLNGGR